jgi:hypothetical protein
VPAPGVQEFNGAIDLRPGQELIVTIRAALQPDTGVLTWRLTAIDPATGALTEDPDAGFLPPNLMPPEGAGSVAFSIAPWPHLPTNTALCNAASIVFDLNDAIETAAACNRLDVDPPASAVEAATPACDGRVAARWSGRDAGGGIAAFTIMVSEAGGPPHVWLADTVETSALYPGQPGRRYAFHSIASDLVGNVEAAPAAPDAVADVPAACCASNADCNDGDACNGGETCDTASGVCVAGLPVSGLISARCICPAAAPPACAGMTLPRRLVGQATRACNALDRVGAIRVPAQTLLGKVARIWQRAGRMLDRRAAQRTLSPACINALRAFYADAATRAEQAAALR